MSNPDIFNAYYDCQLDVTRESNIGSHGAYIFSQMAEMQKRDDKWQQIVLRLMTGWNEMKRQIYGHTEAAFQTSVTAAAEHTEAQCTLVVLIPDRIADAKVKYFPSRWLDYLIPTQKLWAAWMLQQRLICTRSVKAFQWMRWEMPVFICSLLVHRDAIRSSSYWEGMEMEIGGQRMERTQ